MTAGWRSVRIAALVAAVGAAGIVNATQTLAMDRVSTGVRAISENPGNRLAPVAAEGEVFTSYTLEPGVKVTVQRPKSLDAGTTPLLVLYLLPNGNTTEQAEGRTSSTELDWHYDIQHIAAQTRRVKELMAPQPVITAVMEADTLSWPAWRKAVPDSDKLVAQMVDEVRKREADGAPVDLVAHSGGGSFIWGFLNAHPAVPDWVQRIVFLDANYSYEDADGHGDKLLAWLKGSEDHRLVVLAYDDRKVTIGGKPIVSETGGTWRATDRMARRLEKDLEFTAGTLNDLQTSRALGGRVLFARHPNGESKILHTVLVERNGFVYGVAEGRGKPEAEDLPFSNGEKYRKLIR